LSFRPTPTDVGGAEESLRVRYPLLKKEGRGEVNSPIGAYNCIRLSANLPPLGLPLLKGEINENLYYY
jgi:hypothetical protein